MSSPMGVSDETRSQDSVHASLQFAAGTALADTASSRVPRWKIAGQLLDEFRSRAPNVAYLRGWRRPEHALRFTGAAKVPVSLRRIGRTTSCESHNVVRDWWNKARRRRSLAWVA